MLVTTVIYMPDDEPSSVREFYSIPPNSPVLLNHGGYGRVATPVHLAQLAHQKAVDLAPTKFFQYARPGRIKDVVASLAAFLKADPQDLVIVPNATFALNALGYTSSVHNWRTAGTSLDYDGVAAMWDQLSSRGLTHQVAKIDPKDQDLADQISALRVHSDLLLVPHVVSSTSTLIDLDRLDARRSRGGAFIAVDGAHGPGMLDLDLSSPPFSAYVGDAHKWLGAPRGTAFLWASPELQEFIRWPISSVSTAQPDFRAQTSWLGTTDPSVWLSIPDAIDFWNTHLAPVRPHLSQLVASASLALSILGYASLPSSSSVLMRTFVAPPDVTADSLKARLAAHEIDAPVISHASLVMLRISFSWYTNDHDIDRLLDALS